MRRRRIFLRQPDRCLAQTKKARKSKTTTNLYQKQGQPRNPDCHFPPTHSSRSSTALKAGIISSDRKSCNETKPTSQRVGKRLLSPSGRAIPYHQRFPWTLYADWYVFDMRRAFGVCRTRWQMEEGSLSNMAGSTVEM